MGHDVWLDSLRRAAGDADSLGGLLADRVPADALQHVGDAILGLGLAAGPGLGVVVQGVVEQLRDRQWDGDAELVDALEHVSGRSASLLRPLAVELSDVGEALCEHAGSENYLDLQDGMVWLQSMTDFGVADDFDVDFTDASRWLLLVGEGPDDAYRDLERFIGTVADDAFAGRLRDAIGRRGAFRRFRSVLERDPAEFTRWHRFDADAKLGHGRRWLAEQGYEARPLRYNRRS